MTYSGVTKGIARLGLGVPVPLMSLRQIIWRIAVAAGSAVSDRFEDLTEENGQDCPCLLIMNISNVNWGITMLGIVKQLISIIVNIGNIIWTFITNETIIAAIIGAVIAGAVTIYTFSKPSYKMRAEFKREARQSYLAIKEEKAFFDVPRTTNRNPKNFFYKNISLKNSRGESVALSGLKRSFVIKGAPGSGKSAVIKRLFYIEYCKARFFNRNLALYYDSSKIKRSLDNTNDLLSKMRTADFKRLTLVLDGIDETVLPTENEKISSFLDGCMHVVDRLRIIICCRNEYSRSVIEKYYRDQYQLEVYEVEKWSKEQVIDYTQKLISLFSDNKDQSNKLKGFFSQEHILQIIDFNPLLAKMLLCIKLYNSEYEPLENKFEFYQSFLKILTIEHFSNETEIPVFRNNLNRNAEMVFNSYKADVGNREFNYNDVPYFDPIIMKRSGQGTVLFRHESFFEFLLAYYVGLRLQAVSITSIEVLSKEYPNDIADFISDQLIVKSKQEREQIRNNLIAIYGLTINNNKQTEYNNRFNPLPLTNTQYKSCIDGLENRLFFTLKYEIIFRLGRLLLEDNVLNSFLEFAYNDDRVANRYINDSDKNKWIVVLKRCCAISASFVGYEEIEIDYVKHMLPYRKNEYKKLYDIINRSHTLIFYEDREMKNNGILEFLEYMDNGMFDCTKSCTKRVNRLSKLKDIATPVNEMSDKDKRIYYFRLFDIATIYTFIVSRKTNDLLPWLNHDTREIIKTFRTQFKGMSLERKELLDDIKLKTLELLKARYGDVNCTQ